MQEGLIPLLIALLATLLFSKILYRFKIPWVIALIAGGIAIGPFGFGMIDPDPTFNFIASLGLVFLLFVVGLETKFSGLKEVWKEALLFALTTGLFPALVGGIIGLVLGYGPTVALLLAIIFMSSSFAVIIPILNEKGFLKLKMGKVIVASIMIQDIISLIILGFTLQYLNPQPSLPFALFLILAIPIILLIGLLMWNASRLYRVFAKLFLVEEESSKIFEHELRFVFLILIAIVILFEFFGLHPMIGAFFAGLALSEVIKSKELKNKINALAYGFFIPIFFISLGLKTNIRVFTEIREVLLLVLIIVFGSLISKFGSAWLTARLRGYTNTQSSLIGASVLPQLTTTLAVVFVGSQLGILSPMLVTSMIFLSIITTFLGPMLAKNLADRIKIDYKNLLINEK